MIVIGDVHGCFNTLRALLDKIPQDEKDKGVVFTGDLIDRGPSSRQVIDFVKESNYLTVRGNHEQMMLDEYIDLINKMKHNDMQCMEGGWVLNGGGRTIDSYMSTVINNDDIITTFEKGVFLEHIEWVKTLSLFLEFPDIKNRDDRHLVVSHSFPGGVWKYKDKPDQHNKVNFKRNILWGRYYKFKDHKDCYMIFGHTPTKNIPKIKSFYANVDTGCCYNKDGYSKLTALQFPEMIVYQQENIDMD